MSEFLQEGYKPRILLLDKDVRKTHSVYHDLCAAEYQVFVESTISSTLEFLDQNSVNLVVLNLDIVGELGIDLARVLRQRYITPFIVITSNLDDDCVKELIDYGALACLHEPVSTRQLLVSVELALSRSADLGILRAANEGLKLLLSEKRKTNIAVGMMMERYKVSRVEAYDALCSLAKAQQRVLHQIVEDVVTFN